MRLMKGLYFFLLMGFFSAGGAEWTLLENCALVENSFNDGDSFMVKSSVIYRGKTENRFRLYFVDTAETDSNSDFKRDRLKEQATYWRADDPDFALKMGLQAEQTIKKRLRRGFTVYTKGEYAPSMGVPRYYALIRVNDRWLDEILTEEGLVRLYGNSTELPDGTSAESHWRKLHELERTAKDAQRNGWRYVGEKKVPSDLSVFVPHDTVTSRDAWIYSISNGRKVAVLPEGQPVTVFSEADGTRMKVRFALNGKLYEGLCEKSSLNL
ncbi:MAG: micrococcal nuclease [Verrucomicrobiota bacterium]|nr:micrococcal nuclease [Verrucomicrobiota bacterium]MDK2964123.1 micrococcal nuclease [Verrucomicrobiota bacterium]